MPINNDHGDPTEANRGSWKNIVNPKKLTSYLFELFDPWRLGLKYKPEKEDLSHITVWNVFLHAYKKDQKVLKTLHGTRLLYWIA